MADLARLTFQEWPRHALQCSRKSNPPILHLIFNQLDLFPTTQNSHPLDLTKVQMQVVKANDKSAVQFIGGILKQRGAFGLGGI
jgi:hypothetical protein